MTHNPPTNQLDLDAIQTLDLLALMDDRAAPIVSGHLAALVAEVRRLRALADRTRALALLEAANRYAKLADENEAYDGEQGDLDERARIQHETVRDVAAGLRHLADEVDPMVGSLARDGFGPDEIADTLARPAVRPAVETGA